MLQWPLAGFFGFFCYFCVQKVSDKAVEARGEAERIAGDDDAPSLCIHADDKADDNEDEDCAENWQCGRDSGGMDGMVVQGGAREWRGKAGR